MEKKKTFKQFRDDVRKRKIRKRGKRNDENYASQGNKASPESRTRLGGHFGTTTRTESENDGARCRNQSLTTTSATGVLAKRAGIFLVSPALFYV